ncbi:hypothetical protein JZ751_008844 [Albula glossodonta]|uniref:STAS domain-containing protein n=1 Tax=Albula glossodonta TaxID=121402 RepID=A0A8T2P1W0_9TELE|nr:hypothetical protein JZ751_008844 [Albula glossodonta]
MVTYMVSHFRGKASMDPHPMENNYSVSRPIYSNPTFESENERQFRDGSTQWDRLRRYCRESLTSAVISAVSTGLVCSLQGLAYALLVSVATVYGLYSAFVPILTYFLLGTSRHISVVTGLLQVGFVVQYLSDPLVGGFTTAAAFHVLVSQIKIVLSVPTNNHRGLFSIVYTLIDVFTNIDQTNLADLGSGLLTFAIVIAVKEVNSRFQDRIPTPIPIEVIVTVVATGVSHVADLNAHDAVVGYAVSVSVAKVYATKHDYVIDGNQELIAFGVSNIFCGCFSSFVASTTLSRTAVQESTGGRSQVAGMVSAAMVLIVITALGNLLEPLQKPVLAAIVMVNLKGMFVQAADVPMLWRQSRADCVTNTRCTATQQTALLSISRHNNGAVSAVSLAVDNQGFECQRNLRQNSELWTRLPVPKVHIHSPVLGFSAVSFLDVQAAKSLKHVTKEFSRIGVNVYIAGCDDDIVRALEALPFYDETVTRDLLPLSVHDAVLFIKLNTPNRSHSRTFQLRLCEETGMSLPVVDPFFISGRGGILALEET